MKKYLVLFILIALSVFCSPNVNYKAQVVNDIEFLETGDASLVYSHTLQEDSPPKFDISKMRNLSYLRNNYYAVDKKTGMAEDMFNVDRLMATDVHINIEETGPKIMIFHTHGNELYCDSEGKDQGIMGVGEYLKGILEDKYGIECLHITEEFDKVGGNIQRDGAYERAEPVITKLLKENPSVQLVIDLHRDGVNENLRLVTNSEGEQCAKVMFFNGLCRKWENGKLKDIESLKNPYLQTNLALSLKMQLKMNELYPNLTRKIYLNAYRYSLHMKDKSMLIELGAQTNTFQEALNSADRIAEALYEVVVEGW